MSLLEILEPRVLLSGTAAQITIEARLVEVDSRSFRTDLNDFSKLLTKGEATVKADLAEIKVSTAQYTLELNLKVAINGIVSTLPRDEGFFFGGLPKEAQKLAADEKKLIKTPTNATLQSRVNSDSTTLSGSAIFGESVFDFSTKSPAVFSGLDAITSANPGSSRIALDVSKISSGLTSALNKEQSGANELLVFVVPTLVGFAE
jgi:hypothetical protein